MNVQRPASLLEHFTRQFAEQAARGGSCAGPLSEATYAGQTVRRLQSEVHHAEQRAEHASELHRRAEERAAQARADVQHWDELAQADMLEEYALSVDIGLLENMLVRATAALSGYEDAYQTCRSGPGGHEKGACAAESAALAHWKAFLTGYRTAIEELRKKGRAVVLRKRRDERSLDAAKTALAAAQEGVDRTAAESDLAAEELAGLTRELLTAKEALAQALSALRKCRKEHPAEDCGEFGGPGVRLYGDPPKCASWKDVGSITK